MNKIIVMFILTSLSISTFGGAGSIAGGSNGGSSSGERSVGGILGKIFKPVKVETNLREELPWNDILKDKRAIFSNHRITFGTRRFDIWKTCLIEDATKFRSIEKFPVYKNRKVSKRYDNDGVRDGYMNVVVGEDYQYLKVSRIEKVLKCASNGKRCRYKKVLKKHNLSRNISVN